VVREPQVLRAEICRLLATPTPSTEEERSFFAISLARAGLELAMASADSMRAAARVSPSTDLYAKNASNFLKVPLDTGCVAFPDFDFDFLSCGLFCDYRSCCIEDSTRRWWRAREIT
jgi:hypothetical protein